MHPKLNSSWPLPSSWKSFLGYLYPEQQVTLISSIEGRGEDRIKRQQLRSAGTWSSGRYHDGEGEKGAQEPTGHHPGEEAGAAAALVCHQRCPPASCSLNTLPKWGPSALGLWPVLWCGKKPRESKTKDMVYGAACDCLEFLFPRGRHHTTIKDTLRGESVQLTHRDNGSMDLSLGQELRVSVFPLLTPSVSVWDGSPHTTRGSWQQTQTGSVWKPSQRPMVPPGAGRGETTSAICVHLKLFSLQVRVI